MRILFIALFVTSISLNLFLGWGLYLVTPSTIVASGFQLERFREISCGMNQDDVRKLLGDPLRIEDIEQKNGKGYPEVRWVYSAQGDQIRRYHYYAVAFSRDGAVAEVSAEIHED